MPMESDSIPFDIHSVPAETNNRIVQEVEAVYQWIDRQIGVLACSIQDGCMVCGKCCDFETYDHRLFVTTPEIVYFSARMDQDEMRIMTGGVCPYLYGGKCSVHNHRFAGCRIFLCKESLSSQQQAQLSEESLRRFKGICQTYDLPYRYGDLKTALSWFTR
ncbi:MAG: YkgJ family cysteine cluster protein [Sedimentisphaerales bacterium]|nr:YkgJ family cysteine cluster protein [Sedimentisphaerales bacterium]